MQSISNNNINKIVTKKPTLEDSMNKKPAIINKSIPSNYLFPYGHQNSTSTTMDRDGFKKKLPITKQFSGGAITIYDPSVHP